MRNLSAALIFALTIILTAGPDNQLFAQDRPAAYSRGQEQAPGKVFWGANLGLVVGSYTNIGAAPYIGYSVAPSTDIGAGPFYQYAAYRRKGYSSYGGRAFLRQGVISNFFAQAEYEYMDTEDPDVVVLEPEDRERINISSLFLGAGYYGGIGRRVRMHFAILFNVLDNDYRPYRDPVIRIGFSRYF